MNGKVTKRKANVSSILNSDSAQNGTLINPNKKRNFSSISESSLPTENSPSVLLTKSAVTLDDNSEELLKEGFEVKMHPSNISDSKSVSSSQTAEEAVQSGIVKEVSGPKSTSLLNTNSSAQNFKPISRNLLHSTWLQCGKCAMELNADSAVAIKCFESALRHLPSSSETINLLVDSLVNQCFSKRNVDGIKMAIDLINSAMSSYPEIKSDTKLWFKLSNNYLLVNDFKRSHLVIESALEHNKNDPLLWLGLGKCLLKLNMPKEAVDALTKASYLLPNELVDSAEINISRSVHLEMTQIAINDGNLDSAKDELNSALSLPAPTDSRDLELCTSLVRDLALLFERSDDLITASRICEVAESKVPEEPVILLVHSYLLLSSDKPSFNPTKARSLLHKVIQKDRYYIESDNVVDFIQSANGDFLPWLLLSRCYDFLKYYNIAFDCLEIAARKLKYPTILPFFKTLATEILNASDNTLLTGDVERFLAALDSAPQEVKDIPLVDILMMSYDERIGYFNNKGSVSSSRKSSRGGNTDKEKNEAKSRANAGRIVSHDLNVSTNKPVYYDLTKEEDNIESNSHQSTQIQAQVPTDHIHSTSQIVSPPLSSQLERTHLHAQSEQQQQQQQQIQSMTRAPVYQPVSSPLSKSSSLNGRPLPPHQASQWTRMNSYPENKMVRYNNVGLQSVSANESAVYSPVNSKIPIVVNNSPNINAPNMSNGHLVSSMEVQYQQERQYIPIVHQQQHIQTVQAQHQPRQTLPPNVSPRQQHLQMRESTQSSRPLPLGPSGPPVSQMIAPNGQIIQQMHIIPGPIPAPPRPAGPQGIPSGQQQMHVHTQLQSQMEEQSMQFANTPGYSQVPGRVGFARQPGIIQHPGMVNGPYMTYDQPGRQYMDERMRIQQPSMQAQRQAQPLHHVQMQMPPEVMQMSPVMPSRGPTMIPGPVSGMQFTRY